MQKLHPTKRLTDSILEGFVLLVYLSEFLLAVVLYDVVYVNLSCLEECTGHVGVCVVADLDLLTLDLDLLQ